jgi:hypothetical protein
MVARTEVESARVQRTITAVPAAGVSRTAVHEIVYVREAK